MTTIVTTTTKLAVTHRTFFVCDVNSVIRRNRTCRRLLASVLISETERPTEQINERWLKDSCE